MFESIIGLFSKAGDLASEAIEDKDKRNELNSVLEQLKQQVYIQEIQTKTIPWVDALHKMSRPLISMVAIMTAGVVITLNPDIDLMKLLAGGGPAVLYTAIKGKGN